MKVSELIDELSNLDPDIEVVMSKDGEGNRFSPFADLGTYLYQPDSPWSGEIIDEGSKDDYDEDEWEELITTLPYVAVLWPVN